MQWNPMARSRFVGLLAWVAAVLQAGALAQTANGWEEAPAKTVRVLAVGNSFSENATRYLPAVVGATQHKLVLSKASIGGGRLQQHWEKAEAFQRDPQSEAARYASGKTLHELLTSEPWDYVTIQQYSFLSHDPETYEPWATKLVEFIQTHAPTARILVHQTWAYREDDPRFSEGTTAYGKPEGGPKSQREMYERLTAAYDELAAKFEARVIPVGDAFYRADTDPQWGFKPSDVDRAKYTYPESPSEPCSLHSGWYWAKQKDGNFKFRYDGHHAGTAGQYLGALVWFEVLFDESAAGNGFAPTGIEPEYAAFLQRVAHEAVEAREGATMSARADAILRHCCP